MLLNIKNITSPALPLPKLVIFDWDNTLVDTKAHLSDARLLTLNTFKAANYIQNTLESSASSKDFFLQFKEDDQQAAKEFFYNAYHNSTKDGITTISGSLKIIELLYELKISLVILSNKTEEILLDEINNLKWQHYFNIIIGSNGVHPDKPSIEVINLALENYLHIDRKDIWLIGDANVDIECANNYGCIPILYGDLSEFDPNKFITQQIIYCADFVDLINYLNGLLKTS
jgi:phosphoglycolate phosphatase